LPLCLLPLSLAFACGGGDSPPQNPVACDPLSADETPVALGTILGAGRDASGTVYVVDHVEAGDRVFVSQANVLYRERVTGSGEGPSFRIYTLGDHVPILTLQIDTAGGQTRMGVVMGQVRMFVIGQEGEELAPLSAADVSSLTVRNLPPQVVLEYAASLQDGRWLVVVRPRDDWTYEDFRAFFGPKEGVVERRVVRVLRQRDGGSTTISLDVDGTTATASFPIVFDGTTFQPGPASLEIGGQTLPLMLLARDTKPDGAQYLCLSR